MQNALEERALFTAIYLQFEDPVAFCDRKTSLKAPVQEQEIMLSFLHSMSFRGSCISICVLFSHGWKRKK